MDYTYLLAPFVGWVSSGGTKFLVTSVLERRLAIDLIGTYGGLPSTHSTIVTTTAALIGFKAGIGSPAFGVAVALCVIVIMDATGLRRHVGRHASSLNKLLGGQRDHRRLHERVGHHRTEVLAGCALGVLCGYLLSHIPSVPRDLDAVPAAQDPTVGPDEVRGADDAHVGLSVHRLFLPDAVTVADLWRASAAGHVGQQREAQPMVLREGGVALDAVG